MNLFPAFQSRSAEELEEAYENVGTPDYPIERPRMIAIQLADGTEIVDGDAGSIPTGQNAQRSTADRWKRFLAGDKKDEDAFFPTESRRTRRAGERIERTRQRKDQARYFRRELAKERNAR